MKVIKIRNTIGWHVTNEGFSKEFQKALDSGEDIELHISSPGGSVYQGWEMFNEIRMAVTEGATVRTYNLSMAASMASMLFLAVPKENRYMSENSLFMIHNPKGLAFGDADKMRMEANMLDKITDLGADLYAKESGTSPEYMKAAMKATTWYKPKEADEEGFLGHIVDGKNKVEKKDKIRAVGMDKEIFEGMPDELSKVLCFSDKIPKMDSESEKHRDLTKISNSQIREKAWKKFMKY